MKPCWLRTTAGPNSPFARRHGHHDWLCTPWQPTQDRHRRTKRKANLLIPQNAHSLGEHDLANLASSKCLNGTPPSVDWGNCCSSRPCLKDRSLFHPILSTKPESHPISPRLFPSAFSHCEGPSSLPLPIGSGHQPSAQAINIRKMVPIQQLRSNLAVPFLAFFGTQAQFAPKPSCYAGEPVQPQGQTNRHRPPGLDAWDQRFAIWRPPTALRLFSKRAETPKQLPTLDP
jgi:hypothetical protein